MEALNVVKTRGLASLALNTSLIEVYVSHIAAEMESLMVDGSRKQGA